jgi:hypothetical protein
MWYRRAESESGVDTDYQHLRQRTRSEEETPGKWKALLLMSWWTKSTVEMLSKLRAIRVNNYKNSYNIMSIEYKGLQDL